MTYARTVAGIVAGIAVLGGLTGCGADAPEGSLLVSETVSSASGSADEDAGSKPTNPALAGSLFSGSGPVNIADWWRKHPDLAPSDLGEQKLLFNKRGTGPQRFAGPDVRKYDKILMIITCSSKAKYVFRLQVLDGLSIASTTADSCGGPELNTYVPPPLNVTDSETEVEVQVPAGTKYYVTLYGTPSD